ncbi:PepSY domain-containing protein [Acidovorax sp. Leaf160]|uniref:PepSY-associated TM helix domain-containing protein n=1 Tax=Acidovorax sp. Leaf160 TaxID=1736280 RepID=UPI0006FF40EB|nr:PepSY-associated TM helix domain-containing protein [Acidovorax sp. Leaf160]KQR55501.1 peptidase [Acidovorax sp. Leaf160]
MFSNFRLAMAWLHTWFGLVMGFVLMVVFFFGALSVFDREIDRWAIPQTRFEPQPMPSFDRMLRPIFQSMQPDAANVEQARSRVNGPMAKEFPVKSWGAYTTHRDPVLGIFAGFELPNAKDPEDTVWGLRTVDPRNGQTLPDDHLKIGSQFFYPLHYSLNLNWMNLGIWIVGFAALIMLVALVSGVVMHRKIFRELFTFRPKKHTQRSALDLHNLTGVVALPFHFIFAFSGLVIFGSTYYFPITHTQLHPLHELHEKHEAEETGLPHERAGVAGPLASVDAMVAEAQRRWAESGKAGDVGFLNVQHAGDANSYVSVYRAGTDRIALVGDGIHFKAATGEVLRVDPPLTAVASVNTFLTGLHLQHFRHWLLRWLYVLGGLSGCICIATGFIFFVEKRKRQHARQGVTGARWVDGFAVATVTGMVVAALAMLIANRLLPDQMPPGWAGKGDWERYAFWGAWLLAFLHGLWRTAPVAQARVAPAWREQCWAIAVLAVAAVLLNWLTTGDHLLRTIGAGYWPVAGLDLAILSSALIALLAARRLKRRADGAPLVDAAKDTGRSSPKAPHPEAARA